MTKQKIQVSKTNQKIIPSKILKKVTEDKKETNKKIDYVFKKYKKGWKKRFVLTKFDTPCVLLLRNGRKGEFYQGSALKQRLMEKGLNLMDGVSSCAFSYTHSTGENRQVDLKEGDMITMPYGDDELKFYIHHEDWATPLVITEPLLEFKRQKNMIYNAMSAELKWKAMEKAATAKIIMAVVIGIAVLVGGYILYAMLAKPDPALVAPVANFTNNTMQTIVLPGG